MKKVVNVLILIFPLLFLSGCDWLVKEKIVYECSIPENFLQPTDYKDLRDTGITDFGTTVDTYIPYLKGKVNSCNVDKKSIVRYIKLNEEGEPNVTK